MNESWGETLFLVLPLCLAIWLVLVVYGVVVNADEPVLNALWFTIGWFLGSVLGRRVRAHFR